MAKALLLSLLAHALALAIPFGRERTISYPAMLTVTLSVSRQNTPVPESVPAQGVEMEGASLHNEVVELSKPKSLSPSGQNVQNRKPVYFPVSALSKKPRLLNPEWLDTAWTLPSQAQGELLLRLLIDQNGSVVAVESESGPSELFEWIREELPKRARFSAGEQNGVPVRSAIVVRIHLEAVSR